MFFENRRRFTSSHVDSFTRDIERHVAVDTDARERSHDFTRVGIKNDEPRRLAGGSEEAMVGFVKGDGVGLMRFRQGPSGNELVSI